MSDPNRVLTVKVRNYSIEVRGPALHVGRGGDPAVETFLRPLLIAALYAKLQTLAPIRAVIFRQQNAEALARHAKTLAS